MSVWIRQMWHFATGSILAKCDEDDEDDIDNDDDDIDNDDNIDAEGVGALLGSWLPFLRTA